MVGAATRTLARKEDAEMTASKERQVRRVFRGLAVLTVVAFLVAGCSSTKKENDGGSSGSPSKSSPASKVEDGPGVTDSEVKVGFVNVPLAKDAAAQSFLSPDQGDFRAQVEAVTDWVNDHGGVGGRTLVPVVRDFEAGADSPQAEEELCNAFTKDDEVFAVVLLGQLQSNARPCYAQSQTLMLDLDLIAKDRQVYEDLAPYLWSPILPAYDDVITSLVAVLDDEGYLGSDAKVGLLSSQGDVNERVAVLAREMIEALGATVVATEFVDTASSAAIFSSLPQIIQKFKSAGVNRVISLAGTRIMPIFTTLAKGESYTPRLAITTFDNPTYYGLNARNSVPIEMMKDAVGIGIQLNRDITDEVLAFPTAREKDCAGIFEDAGVEFDAKLDPNALPAGIEAERLAARTALSVCDVILLLQAGAEGSEATGLDAEVWAEHVQSLGDSVQLASAYQTSFEKGSFTGGAAYRVIVWDEDQQKFVFKGGDVEPIGG